ncbi:MAG: hypothetical protein HY866_06430 [Chloroflexi bacterium]|nr:hypothetical protein [Chloroflexota bacterium]
MTRNAPNKNRSTQTILKALGISFVASAIWAAIVLYFDFPNAETIIYLSTVFITGIVTVAMWLETAEAPSGLTASGKLSGAEQTDQFLEDIQRLPNKSTLSAEQSERLIAEIMKLKTQVDDQSKRLEDIRLHWRDWLMQAVGIFIVFVVGLVLAWAISNLADAWRDSRTESSGQIVIRPNADDKLDEYVLDQANGILRDAEQAAESASRVLNFMEGASLLLALALGAAAIYGFRNAQEIRRELKEEKNELTALRERIETDQRETRKMAELSRQALEQSQQALRYQSFAFIELIEAYQQLQHKNYRVAYDTALRLLELDEDNPAGQYIAGWLELQFIPDKLDQGIKRLEEAYRLPNRRLTVKAAYGVALRRKAQRFSDAKNRQQMSQKAEAILLEVLREQFYLLDLNSESFWGPVGGIRREAEDYEGAIEAYRKACQVTPESSYPRGNLAALLLHQVQHTSVEAANYAKTEAEALNIFRTTINLAELESGLVPHEYFHKMDIVMSRMILGLEDPTKFSRAQEELAQVLGFEVTTERLIVSLRGWKNLHDFCPAHEKWQEVFYYLKVAILKVALRLAEIAWTEGLEHADPYDKARQGVETVLTPLLQNTAHAQDFLNTFRVRLKPELEAASTEWKTKSRDYSYPLAREPLAEILRIIDETQAKIEQGGLDAPDSQNS